MDTIEKSEGNVEQSQSSCSRRVMWKVSDTEEEVFDSVVNYRRILPPRQVKGSSSANFEQEPCTSKPQAANEKWRQLMKQLNKEDPKEEDTKSSTSLALRYKPSHESLKSRPSKTRARALRCWHHLFERIRSNKMSVQSSPSLALRYKPSLESLKKRSSQEAILKRPQSERQFTTEDIKLETCFFPPYQRAVVREVAPKFANRLCVPDETDSCCSGSIELRIPLQKSVKMPISRTTPETCSLISQAMAKSTNIKLKRRINKSAASSSGAVAGGASKSSKSASTSGSNICSLPTLRQRQQELHRYRVQIEKRRLELLDLKIVRERADALRHEILFHKDLQLKHNQIKAYEDNNSSQA